MKKKADVLHIIEELKIRYPDGICSLDYPKDYELLFSVRLAASSFLKGMTMANVTLE